MPLERTAKPSTDTAQDPMETVLLQNERGDSVRILALGAIINEFNIATKTHGVVNIVLGYPHLHSYYKDTAYHGAIAGRYCNRIANSQFELNKQTFILDANEPPHHLHGGSDGFNRRLWSIEDKSESHATLSLHSPDGDQGYPGNLDIMLRYELTQDSALEITWQAKTDRDTVVCLTSHGYFNLAGHGDILDHHIRIPAGHYTAVDDQLIPTGSLSAVENTCLDLRGFTRLGSVAQSDDPLVAPFAGLDHNWARGSTGEMQRSAELLSPHTNLLLEVDSTLPGLQCYTGNHLMANSLHGSHEGVCLEPQHYPNSPNQPEFPSPCLRAGETIEHKISYQIRQVDAQALLS